MDAHSFGAQEPERSAVASGAGPGGRGAAPGGRGASARGRTRVGRASDTWDTSTAAGTTTAGSYGGETDRIHNPSRPNNPKSDPKTACFAPNLVWKTWQQGRAVTSGPISSRQMTQALSSAGSASGVAPGRLCGMELWGKIPHHVRPMGVMRGRPKGSPSSLSSLISLFNYIVSQVWGHPEPSSLPIRSSQPIFGGQKWPISPRFGSALLKADPTPPKETNAATGTFPPPHSPSLPELIEAFNYISRRP